MQVAPAAPMRHRLQQGLQRLQPPCESRSCGPVYQRPPSVQEASPGSPTYSPLPAPTRPYHTTMQVARSGACAAALGGRLYVCGGLGHEGGLRSV